LDFDSQTFSRLEVHKCVHFFPSLLSLLCLSSFTGCGGETNSNKPSDESNRPVETNESSLPDRIKCDQDFSNYQLVLVIKDQNLPEEVTAIALKDDETVLFKVATQIYTVEGEPNILNFVEIPATTTSKEVKLNLTKKKQLYLTLRLMR